jgi:hypothetical protein
MFLGNLAIDILLLRSTANVAIDILLLRSTANVAEINGCDFRKAAAVVPNIRAVFIPEG